MMSARNLLMISIYMKKISLEYLHLMRIVRSVCYLSRHFGQGQNIMIAVGKLYAVDASLQLQ